MTNTAKLKECAYKNHISDIEKLTVRNGDIHRRRLHTTLVEMVRLGSWEEHNIYKRERVRGDREREKERE